MFKKHELFSKPEYANHFREYLKQYKAKEKQQIENIKQEVFYLAEENKYGAFKYIK